jgi:hypothetical protein
MSSDSECESVCKEIDVEDLIKKSSPPSSSAPSSAPKPPPKTGKTFKVPNGKGSRNIHMNPNGFAMGAARDMVPTTGRLPPQPKEPKLDDSGVRKSIKGMVFSVGSQPVRDPVRRNYFQQQLEQNKFMGQYVEKRLCGKLFDYMNDDVKAVVCYGALYVNAINADIRDMVEKKNLKDGPSKPSQES